MQAGGRCNSRKMIVETQGLKSATVGGHAILTWKNVHSRGKSLLPSSHVSRWIWSQHSSRLRSRKIVTRRRRSQPSAASRPTSLKWDSCWQPNRTTHSESHPHPSSVGCQVELRILIENTQVIDQQEPQKCQKWPNSSPVVRIWYTAILTERGSGNGSPGRRGRR